MRPNNNYSSCYKLDRRRQRTYDHSLVAIPQTTPYEAFSVAASVRPALSYARAGANPNALAYGLGIALFADTSGTF